MIETSRKKLTCHVRKDEKLRNAYKSLYKSKVIPLQARYGPECG